MFLRHATRFQGWWVNSLGGYVEWPHQIEKWPVEEESRYELDVSTRTVNDIHACGVV